MQWPTQCKGTANVHSTMRVHDANSKKCIPLRTLRHLVSCLRTGYTKTALSAYNAFVPTPDIIFVRAGIKQWGTLLTEVAILLRKAEQRGVSFPILVEELAKWIILPNCWSTLHTEANELLWIEAPSCKWSKRSISVHRAHQLALTVFTGRT